ncbi:hypothetical protein ADUPG1_010971, partial [Aduncisulcus paluster]
SDCVEGWYGTNCEFHDVSIPDANLRAAVCSALVASLILSDDCSVITNIDMLSLTSLSASSVDTFEGLSYATNLASLTIDGTSTSDLEIDSTEIGYLPTSSLSTLYLQNIALSEDVSLSAFTMLTKLDLRNTGLTDSHIVLGSLSGVEEQLVELTLRENSISDISALSGMVNLTYLYLYNNQISDIIPLESLVKLTILELGSNQIKSIDSLSNMELSYLQLANNEISDVSDLSEMSNLTTLYIGGNKIYNISPLSELTELITLSLSSNDISDISDLSSLTNLTHLHLSYNEISSIGSLINMIDLQYLYLHYNNITDISALSGKRAMIELYLNNNDISNISALTNMENMNSLRLQNNRISDISPLAGMYGLTDLYLHYNNISNIYFLSSMNDLSILNLSNNPLSTTMSSSLTTLSSLPSLTTLTLDSVGLCNTSLRSLSMFPALSTLSIRSNGLTDISLLFPISGLSSLDVRDNKLCNVSDTVYAALFPLSPALSVNVGSSDSLIDQDSSYCAHCSEALSSMTPSDNVVCREVWTDEYQVECALFSYRDYNSSSSDPPTCVSLDASQSVSSAPSCVDTLVTYPGSQCAVDEGMDAASVHSDCIEDWYGDDCEYHDVLIPDANLRAAVCSALVASLILSGDCPTITNIDMLSLTT